MPSYEFPATLPSDADSAPEEYSEELVEPSPSSEYEGDERETPSSAGPWYHFGNPDILPPGSRSVLTRREAMARLRAGLSVMESEAPSTGKGPGDAGDPEFTSKYADTFSAHDCTVYVIVPPSIGGDRSKVPPVLPLATAHMISYSSFRATPFARPVGYVNPKGFGRATRTVTGNMRFYVTRADFLRRLIWYLDSYANAQNEMPYYALDQLPPVDLMLMFANEYGSSAFRVLRGVIFTTEDMTTGVGAVETTLSDVSFIGLDATPITPMSEIDPNDGETADKREIDSNYFKRIHGTEMKVSTYEDVFASKYSTIFANTNRYLF